MTDDIWEAALAERQAQESETVEVEENPETIASLLCTYCYGDDPVPCARVSRETSSLL